VPEDVQDDMIHLLAGCENAKIVHYAYAIEYDYCPALQLKPNLETKKIGGLFLAGQINGTSGYEEAAAQGIMAGINAVQLLENKEPVIIGRDQAYIGVLIDDLLTREIDEPYRMFTSRAEYRLSLRSDNADRRLTQIGRTVGLVDDKRWAKFEQKLEQIENLSQYLANHREKGLSLWQQLEQPNNSLAGMLAQKDEIAAMNLPERVISTAIIDAKYQGYLIKQEKGVRLLRRLDGQKLPKNLDYDKVAHLRAEARQKLSAFRPYTLGQAGRIGGITPADIMVIQIHLRKTSGLL